jgi:hypothetical protein
MLPLLAPLARRLLAGLIVAVIGVSASSATAAVWQWSVPIGYGRAFLWIPENCPRVRAVVVGQNNMIEGGILEKPALRDELARLGIAEVYVAPPFDGRFLFDQGAGERFDAMMKALADESGYAELALAPVAPLGHSACASYPWNFAAWNPARTLAILSVHGDAPQTDRTGSGKPNPDWGDRNIDGVPGLMVMGEYEWHDDRLTPALAFRARHPLAPIAMLAEPGNGHFNYSDPLINFLALFLRKAAEARLPAVDGPRDQPTTLRPVDPKKGWLVERWHLNTGRTVPPAPFDKYTGDPADAFWAFDEETARAIQDYFAGQIGKRPQLLGWVQNGQTLPTADNLNGVTLRFEPEADGVTFHLAGTFLDKVEDGAKNLARWTGQPVGTPLGHATGGGPIEISRITGPVAKLGPDTFALALDRSCSTRDVRNNDLWLLESQPGDANYKRVVQQAIMHIPRNSGGRPQSLKFDEILDQPAGTKGVQLTATSDAGAKVYYYVREGPAEVDGDHLRLTPIPPTARFPVKITVVAWQWGWSAEPKLDTAEPVTRTFAVTK